MEKGTLMLQKIIGRTYAPSTPPPPPSFVLSNGLTYGKIHTLFPYFLSFLRPTAVFLQRMLFVVHNKSSVKWSVLAHLES